MAGPLKHDPLQSYIQTAAGFLEKTQAADGSWNYSHSRTADFSASEPHENLFGTMMTLTNLAGTGFETSGVFDRGAAYIEGRMEEGYFWSLYEPGRFNEDAWIEPDADDTAVALTVLAGRIAITAGELDEVRHRFERHRTADGLYLTYFDGFHGKKGFVPDVNVPSLGVNLNVLGFFARYGLPRTHLVEGLRTLTRQPRYWEKTPYYRSLPVLAFLASNALEQRAAEAEELLNLFLTDIVADGGADPSALGRLPSLELAAYIKARSHRCLLDRDPCWSLDPLVRELAERRRGDGSWDAAPFYEYDVNPGALVAFLDRRDFLVARPGRGAGYDVERALASPGTVRYYDGSPAETTSFALKALVVYREAIGIRSAPSRPGSLLPRPPERPQHDDRDQHEDAKRGGLQDR